MSDWIQVKGIIKKGHGVASGKSGDPRFPKGTIAMQKPLFAEKGLDISGYFLGTINVSIYPYLYAIEKSKYTFRDVKWADSEPAEDFSFFDCRVILNSGKKFEGLIYYPHPETKPEHFQAPEILELLMPSIRNLNYGDEVVLELDRGQIEIHGN
ncbi:Riboflavin kinase [Tumidithrix helvetica PCC 7403]|uniref:hypothetical protein n=1 Tax=Tumidithrix helvetica TaxID=3457545 RepID=UPI003CA59C54